MGKGDIKLAGLLRFDSIRKFEGAAANRFDEAELLARHGHRMIAIYLYGYCVEMLLKSACFRFGGYNVAQPLREEDRNALVKHAESFGVVLSKFEHHVGKWALFAVGWKRLLHPATPESFLAEVVRNATIVHENWSPEMRYRATEADEATMKRVQDAVSWLRSNHEKMIKKPG